MVRGQEACGCIARARSRVAAALQAVKQVLVVFYLTVHSSISRALIVLAARVARGKKPNVVKRETQARPGVL